MGRAPQHDDVARPDHQPMAHQQARLEDQPEPPVLPRRQVAASARPQPPEHGLSVGARLLTVCPTRGLRHWAVSLLRSEKGLAGTPEHVARVSKGYSRGTLGVL